MIQTALDVDAVGLEVAGHSVSELSEDLGLPGYLVQAMIDARSRAGDSSSGRIGSSRRIPRPQVRIDRYSCNGPYLVLPPVDGGGEWLITGSTASRCTASQRDRREVPLSVAREWSVTHRSDTAESRVRFGGHPYAAAYAFDAGGRLAREQRRLKGDVVLMLTAGEVKVLTGGGAPVPLAEDIPARSAPWQGWKLMCLDISEVDEIVLRADNAVSRQGQETRLPVARPAPAPVITSAGVSGVTGPLGCAVYAEVPSVTVPEGHPISLWRGRWRRDDETSPPPTWMLDDLPGSGQARDMTPRLPRRDAFCGTVEIVGPLGSDLRERVAVVRGLRADLPDRIIGPDETVEAALNADCTLTRSDDSGGRWDGGGARSDGSGGRSVDVVFEPGCDSVEVLADGLPLAVTIPRVSWTVSRRGGSMPVFSGHRERIGSDEIESGEAESLMVRCGRPAIVSLELHGHEHGTLQEAEPVRAAGDQGLWSFPLSQFRDTISASGLTLMRLKLYIDDVGVDAAVIVARYEVSDFGVEIVEHDIDTNETLMQARWRENRPFKDRQLEMWSRHRLWEPPVCAGIPDDATGCFDSVVEIPPGPYLAQITVRDDWATPQPPLLGSADTVEVGVGTPVDVQTRLLKLKPAVAVEALELAVAGHPFREKMEEGPLAEMLVEDLVWRLPRHTMLRLTLVLAASIDCCSAAETGTRAADAAETGTRAADAAETGTRAADAETLEMLWDAFPVAAAVFDHSLDEDSADRWNRFTGWIPTPDSDGPKQPSQPVGEPLDRFAPDRIIALSDALPLTDSLPLQLDGYTLAALEMLEKTWPDREQLTGWMSAHTRVTTYTQRLSWAQHQQIDALSPVSGALGWHKFPARLLTAAFQVTDEYASHQDRDAAVQSLLDAAEIAPLMTTRSLLIAMALRATAAY